MGSPKTTQTTQAKTETAPWDAAIPTAKKVIGQIDSLTGNTGITANENSAFDALTANAQAGNPYAGSIGNLATDLLGNGERTGMVRDSYGGLKAGLTPYANMNTNPYENEAFTKAVGYIGDDVMNRMKSAYAGAGVSPVNTGDFGKTVGEGIARGVAPTWLQAYNDMEGRKLGAIEGLYNAGGQTAGLLTDLASRGVDVSNAATAAKDQPHQKLLEIEAARRNLPVQNVAQLENLIVPMAQLGGTSNTNSTTTQQTQIPMGQQILGGAMAGLGLLSGMPGLGMGGSMFGGAGLLGGFGGLGGLFGNRMAGGMGLPRSGTGGLY